ncbi:heme biosynthesis HemY N-terminal domain-containing protein [Bordetella bronchialis]|uniref:Protoheme IX synthesis protein n=1 Tax=Bordetella bronchialis TaxID=463025 RepID=A0ABM6CR22_9BORD|nr:heme biosynthesis HemY N-terminal domain-containing protein [Bordetella bronchialis]ANN66430.1 protoheme IX synthesis protein [Bordetella bronchialis]
MRTWFWTLLLAVVAVAVAVLLRAHPGNVVLLVSPFRVELSLTLAVLLLIALFVAIYVGLRVLAWLLAIPDRMRAWRGRRAQARDHELLERGWIGLLEGRYAHAEKDLAKLLDQTKARNRRVLAALSAARAAQGLGEFVRRDLMLDRAREAAGSEPGLIEAVATVTADLLLEQGQPTRALEVLAPLQDGGARHLHTLRLLLRAERALGHHERVFVLARGLLRRGAMPREEAVRIIGVSGAARLRGALDEGQWRNIWKDLKAEERLLPDIALAGAAAFEASGESDEAARVLEAAIAQGFDPRLLNAYSRCDAAQVPRRLERAEKWLQQRPTDPDVLCALGMLCLTGQLWGQAERYLRRAVDRRADARTHALLGSLYDRLDRQDDAVRHWRLATAAGIALPVLAADEALPAADMHADPSRVDPESGFLSDAAEAPAPASTYVHDPVPAAPPAADYVLEPDARGRAEPLLAEPAPSSPAPASTPAESAADLEDYFDSAPIPVAGLGDEEPEPAVPPASSTTQRDHPDTGFPPKTGGSGKS